MVKFYLPHLTFFVVFFVAAIPVLYYIQRKNPYPRFRPGFGEMSLITLIAIFVCGALAFGLGSLFKPENDGSSLNKKPDFEAPSAGGSSPEGGRSKRPDRDRDSGDGDDAPRRRLNDKN